MLPPPPDAVMSNVPVLTKLIEAYKQWHRIHSTFERTSRFSLGNRVDGLFIALIEQLFLAKYAKPEQKQAFLQKASILLDLLKFLLQVSWEIKCITHKDFGLLSTPIQETGKMIGGWLKDIEKKHSQ